MGTVADWLDFSASVIDSLAWPAAVVALVFILREQIVRLLGALRRLRYRDLELEFGEQVRVLQEEVREANLPEPEVNEDDFRLAAQSPRALVLESWLRVEEEMARAARRAGVESTGRESAFQLFRQLERRHLVDDHLRAFVADLRVLRNAAAHEPDFAVSPEQALEYSRVARQLAAALRGVATE